MQSLYKQKGSTLITTLIIVFIATMLAVIIQERQQIDIMQTRLSLSASQNNAYVIGTEIWAKKLLLTDLYNIQANPRALLDWPKVLPPTPIKGGSIKAELFDAQARYNINNLSLEGNQAGFMHMLRILLPTLDQQTCDNILKAAISWLSPAGKIEDLIADEFYLAAQPPYRASHQLFVSPSEFRLIYQVTPQLYTRLSPYIIALPTTTPININTASAIALLSLNDKLTFADTQKIIDERNNIGGFQNVDTLVKQVNLSNIEIKTDQATVESKYFLLITDIEIYHQHTVVFSLLQRTIENKRVTVQILWRSIGTL